MNFRIGIGLLSNTRNAYSQVALRISRSVQDAEDVSQDVLTEAFRLHQAGPVQSWTGLLSCGSRRCGPSYRLRRNRPTVELREGDRMSTVGPLEEMEATDLEHWLGKTIAQELPDQQATVFVMHHFEQLSRDQVSRGFPGISPEAVSTSLYKRGNIC